MGCMIDHLQADHRVRVLREFSDVHGMRHGAGESGIIRTMDLDWGRQEIVIEWERNGTTEKLVFALAAKEGPRNGHMREFFEMNEHVPLPKARASAAQRMAPAEPPPLVEGPVTDTAQTRDALARISALAAHGRLDEAETQIRIVLDGQDPFGGRLQQLAEKMVGIAVAHAGEPDRTVFDWARQRAIDLWYAWGSGATSGGEGAARMVYISAAEERLAECERPRG
jgi:hypothetical protein